MKRFWVVCLISIFKGALVAGASEAPGLQNAQKPLSLEERKSVKSEEALNNAGLEIDRIELQGVSVFNSEKIEKVLDIAPGDRLEHSKIVKTEENIQALYRLHGYPEMSIQSRLIRKKNSANIFETILDFQVKEGLPVRISKLNLVSDTPIEETNTRAWSTIQDKIKSIVGMNSGDLLDEEKLAESRKAIQEFLATESFVGAKVTDIKEMHGLPVKEIKGKDGRLARPTASRWVELEFHIDLGDRVIFGFQGNSVFTYGFLSNLVDEQRLLGLGRDYVGAIRIRLEDEYRSAGYSLVNITPFTFEDKNGGGRKVTYYIKEGPRVGIESVEFDGNSVFSSKELREHFYSKASGLVQNGIYVEKDIQKAAEILVDWLKEKGYLAAHLVTVNTTFVPQHRGKKKEKLVRLLIYLYEGDQTIVQSVNITGAHVLTEAVVKNILHLKEGAALNLYALAEGIEQLKKMYPDKGYLSFKIANEGSESVAKYSKENRIVDISLNFEEGKQFKVGRIDIEGLEKTKDYVVRRELTLKPGDILSLTQLANTERKLRRLGIFSTINLRLADDPDSGDTKIIKVVLQEGDRGMISGGPGYRNDLGIRAFGQLSYSNLWGEDHSASINVALNRRFYQYNFLEGQVQVAYSWPWFLLPDLNFRPFISFGATQYINFAAQTLTMAANWQKQLLSNPNLVGEFSYTFESINQFQSIQLGDDLQMNIGSISPKISLDLRDSPLIPTSGLFALVSFDFAMPYLGSRSDIGYYRVQFRTDYYFPLSKDIELYLGFRTGFEQTLEPLPGNPGQSSTTDSIPLIKQFALGGIGSIRGYQLQELNYQGRFTGKSMSYVNYRGELDLPFAGALKFALFLDAGNLLIDNYTFGALLYGTGFGFHYMTPVGPVSFDYGFKVNPLPGTDTSAIYFSVGVI